MLDLTFIFLLFCISALYGLYSFSKNILINQEKKGKQGKWTTSKRNKRIVSKCRYEITTHCSGCNDTKQKFNCSNIECNEIIFHCTKCNNFPIYCTYCSCYLIPSCAECGAIKQKYECCNIKCNHYEFCCSNDLASLPRKSGTDSEGLTELPKKSGTNTGGSTCEILPNFCILCGSRMICYDDNYNKNNTCDHKSYNNMENFNYCLDCGKLLE